MKQPVIRSLDQGDGWRHWCRPAWSVRAMAGLLIGLIALSTVSCTLPQVSAEDRLFLPLSIELLDVAILPEQTVAETPVGGLSALAYDAQT
ncbi:MAG: hypothetical protein AAGA01_10985, partial [Cyanobacteria bacterium P01_E01_bin.43]